MQISDFSEKGDVNMSMISRILFYDAMYIVGFALMLLTSLLGCRIYGIGRVRAAVYSVIFFAAGIGGALLIGVIYNKLQSLKRTERKKQQRQSENKLYKKD